MQDVSVTKVFEQSEAKSATANPAAFPYIELIQSLRSFMTHNMRMFKMFVGSVFLNDVEVLRHSSLQKTLEAPPGMFLLIL